ncbi:MAG: hypothetical protein IPN49_13995 [Saprospiraceae bacterium]|nr:hypothetical protein [Saprospiraceae bacterium]
MVSGIKEISNTALHYRYSSSLNAEYLLKTRPDFLEFFGNLKSKDTLSIELIFDLTSEFQEKPKRRKQFGLIDKYGTRKGEYSFITEENKHDYVVRLSSLFEWQG